MPKERVNFGKNCRKNGLISVERYREYFISGRLRPKSFPMTSWLSILQKICINASMNVEDDGVGFLKGLKGDKDPVLFFFCIRFHISFICIVTIKLCPFVLLSL